MTAKYKELIISRGYETVYTRTLDYEEIISRNRKGDTKWLSFKTLESLFLEQVDIIHKIKPNYVLTDINFTAHMAAEKVGIPSIALVNGMLSQYLSIARSIPYTHPASVLARFCPQFILGTVQRIVEYFLFGALHRPYQVIRRKYGLKRNPHNFMSEFEGDYSLILDGHEFCPQSQLPSDVTVLGPLYHIGTETEDVFLTKLIPNKKTLLINMGSGGNIQNVRFLNDPYFKKYNIIVVGKDTESLDSNHMVKAEFLNLEAVLPHVDLALIQAGTGNIFQSLSHGVPVLCYPTFFEQEWNAGRVQELGYGLSLTGKEPFEKIRGLIDHWSCKKKELRFLTVRTSANARQTLQNFRTVISSLLES